MSDEDWFEQGVGDDGEEADRDDEEAEESTDGEKPEEPTDGEGPAKEEEPAGEGLPEREDAAERVEEVTSDGADGVATEDDDSESSEANEDADAPGVGDGSAFEELEATDDPPSVGEAPDDGDEPGSGLFDDDFTAALQEAEAEGFGSGGTDPADPEFAMGTDAGGGFGATGVPDIDGEVDSDIPRIDLGIEGLDEMIVGGIPERTLMVAIGSAGTGKSTFGLQFLEGGLSQGERAVFIALEESKERVIRSATEKGFPFDEYVEEGQLAIVDMDPVEMANSLQTIGSELPRLIDEFGAERLVLDSVSLLEMMFDKRAARRNEIYDFAKSLKESGVTTMLTSEASEETAYASRHGIVEYLTDAVFILQYVRPSDFRETRMAIEIQKIRDANHSRETKPYEITGEGIEVFRQANLF